MKFSESLRNLRREKDLSQENLANDLGVSRQTVSKWENGTAMPDLKKLTELAEYFNVSMDTLLDINYSSKNNTADNTDRVTPEYVNQVVAYAIENQKIKSKKQIKNVIIISIIIICIAIIALASVFSGLNNRLDNLDNNLAFLQANSNTYVYNDDNESTLPTDYLTYELLGTDEEKPYIATMRLDYEPEKYDKNLNVYYLINSDRDKTVKIEAENNNGVFSTTFQLDLTDNSRKIFICLDNNSDIEKYEVDLKTTENYSEIIDSSDFYYFLYSGIALKNDMVAPIIVNEQMDSDVVSANAVLVIDGKEAYRQSLRFDKNVDKQRYPSGKYRIIISDFIFIDSVKNQLYDADNANIYIEIVFKNSVILKYYPSIVSSVDNPSIYPFNSDKSETIEYDYKID